MLKSKLKFYKYRSSLSITAILIIALLFIITLYFFYKQPAYNNNANYIYINNCKFEVEIAETQQERFLGLGNRKKMRENRGMLFEFPQADDHSFCMRDMKFPLDFIWIVDDNIVSVVKNVPYNFKGEISPHISADKVLELNAGTAEKCGIKKGDKIFY